MNIFPKHDQSEDCPGCRARLLEADKYLADWFFFQKPKFPTLHISWAHRDKKSQDEAFEFGDSKLKWPMSKHNSLPARAVDIFQIDAKGKAVFDPQFCAKVYYESVAQGYTGLVWGGNFKSLGDSGHLEMKDSVHGSGPTLEIPGN